MPRQYDGLFKMTAEYSARVLGCKRKNIHETQTRAIKKIKERMYFIEILRCYTDLTNIEIYTYLKSLNGRSGYFRHQRLLKAIKEI